MVNGVVSETSFTGEIMIRVFHNEKTEQPLSVYAMY